MRYRFTNLSVCFSILSDRYIIICLFVNFNLAGNFWSVYHRITGLLYDMLCDMIYPLDQALIKDIIFDHCLTMTLTLDDPTGRMWFHNTS